MLSEGLIAFLMTPLSPPLCILALQYYRRSADCFHFYLHCLWQSHQPTPPPLCCGNIGPLPASRTPGISQASAGKQSPGDIHPDSNCRMALQKSTYCIDLYRYLDPYINMELTNVNVSISLNLYVYYNSYTFPPVFISQLTDR